MSQIEPNMEPYIHTFTIISGLLCKRALQQRLNSDNTRIRPDDFHRHWFYDYKNKSTDEPEAQIQNPDISLHHIKARRGTIKKSTFRGATAAEREEQRLAKEIANARHIAKLQQAARLAEQREDNEQQQQREEQQQEVPGDDPVELPPTQTTVAALPTKKACGRPPKAAAAAKAAAKRPRITAGDPEVPTVIERPGKRPRKLTAKGRNLAVNQV